MLLVGCFGLFYFTLVKLAKAVLAPQKQNEIHKIRFSLKEKKSFCVFFLSFFSSIIDFSEERDLEYRCCVCNNHSTGTMLQPSTNSVSVKRKLITPNRLNAFIYLLTRLFKSVLPVEEVIICLCG